MPPRPGGVVSPGALSRELTGVRQPGCLGSELLARVCTGTNAPALRLAVLSLPHAPHMAVASSVHLSFQLFIYPYLHASFPPDSHISFYLFPFYFSLPPFHLCFHLPSQSSIHPSFHWKIF